MRQIASFCCLLLLVSFVASTTDFEALKAWGNKNSIPSAFKFEVEEFDGVGDGLLSTQPIYPGEVILSIPESAVLNTAGSLGHPVVGPIINEFEIKSAHVALAFRLIYEKHQPQGKWKEFIETLPALEEYQNYPFFWSDEDLALVEVSEWTSNDVRNQKAHANQLHAVCNKVALDKPHIIPVEACVESEAQWALLTVSSRSFTIIVDNQLSLALIPFLHLVNHNPKSTSVTTSSVDQADLSGIPQNSGVQFGEATKREERYYQLVAGKSYIAGEQIYANYGSKPGSQLLTFYGFVPSESEFSVAMALSNQVNTIFDYTIDALKEKVGCKRPLPFLINLETDAGIGDLLFCMRLNELTPTDYETLMVGGNYTASDVITLRNEQRAVRTLLGNIQMSLQKFTNNLDEDHAELKRKISLDRRLALTLRALEKRVFLHAGDVLRSHWMTILARDFSSEKYN